MGKGGGCVPSKKRPHKRPPAADRNDPSSANAKPLPMDDTDTDTASASHPCPQAQTQTLTQTLTLAPPSSSSFKIFVVFYSMYGHVELLARRMKRGIDGIGGAEGVLYRVPETLSPEVLDQMKAPRKDEGVLVMESPARLAEADGILFGFPNEVRGDGGADEGVLRLHGAAVEGAGPGREAGRVLRQHRDSGRRTGDHRVVVRIGPFAWRRR